MHRVAARRPARARCPPSDPHPRICSILPHRKHLFRARPEPDAHLLCQREVGLLESGRRRKVGVTTFFTPSISRPVISLQALIRQEVRMGQYGSDKLDGSRRCKGKRQVFVYFPAFSDASSCRSSRPKAVFARGDRTPPPPRSSDHGRCGYSMENGSNKGYSRSFSSAASEEKMRGRGSPRPRT